MNIPADLFNHKIRASFGAMAPPLSVQLKDYKISRSTMGSFQRSANEITSLHLRNLLTDAEARKARQRLLNSIAKAVE